MGSFRIFPCILTGVEVWTATMVTAQSEPTPQARAASKSQRFWFGIIGAYTWPMLRPGRAETAPTDLGLLPSYLPVTSNCHVLGMLAVARTAIGMSQPCYSSPGVEMWVSTRSSIYCCFIDRLTTAQKMETETQYPVRCSRDTPCWATPGRDPTLSDPPTQDHCSWRE